MSIGLRAAAEGQSEMAFWPAAATAYIYASSGGSMYLALLVVFALSGGIMYIFHRNVEKIADASKDISQTKAKVSRDGTTSKGVERIIAAFDEAKRIFPDNPYAFWIVWGGILIDIGGGAYLLWKIGEQVVGYADPTVAGVVLFILPILNLFVIGSAVIWNL